MSGELIHFREDVHHVDNISSICTSKVMQSCNMNFFLFTVTLCNKLLSKVMLPNAACGYCILATHTVHFWGHARPALKMGAGYTWQPSCVLELRVKSNYIQFNADSLQEFPTDPPWTEDWSWNIRVSSEVVGFYICQWSLFSLSPSSQHLAA